MNAKRHKRWILVLLPSILAIATLSLSGGIGGHSQPVDGGAPATPAREDATDEPSSTPVSDDSSSSPSGDSEQSDSNAGPYIEAEREEDAEYRPVFHERMLAANYPEPQFRDDAVHGLGFSSASSAGAARFGRGSAAGSAGAGGSSGGASNGSSANTKAEDNSPDEENETTTEGLNGDPASPDTFEDSGEDEQSGSNQPSNTNPIEPKAPGQGGPTSDGPGGKDDSTDRTDADQTSGEGPGPKDEDTNEPIVSVPIVNDDTDLLTDVPNPIDTESDYPPEQPHVNVPEPSTLGLLGIALLGMAVSRKRRAVAGTKRR